MKLNAAMQSAQRGEAETETGRGSVTRSGSELGLGSATFQTRSACGTAAAHRPALLGIFPRISARSASLR